MGRGEGGRINRRNVRQFSIPLLTFSNTQGVMKMRKRVTLMVVIVSAIFGICWGTEVVIFAILYLTSHNIGPVVLSITHTMVLFNSAVNPFVYALLNQHFREKMKRMMSCTRQFAARFQPGIQPTNEIPCVELSDKKTTHLSMTQ